MAEIHIPGPGPEGFRVHILRTDTEQVLIAFGVEITHIPMPPPVAWQLAMAILEKCQELEPDSKLQIRKPSISLQVFERKVLLEVRKATSELLLSPSEGRELVFRLCHVAARAVGRDLPGDFPLENQA